MVHEIQSKRANIHVLRSDATSNETVENKVSEHFQADACHFACLERIV